MPEHCDGCDGPDCENVKPYVVTFTDGKRSDARYCDDCADLCRMNWPGEIAAIELAHSPECAWLARGNAPCNRYEGMHCIPCQTFYKEHPNATGDR